MFSRPPDFVVSRVDLMDRARNVSDAAVSRVVVLRLPAGGAFGNEIEEVPDAAEIVAGRERCVGHPHDPAVLAPEHGDARHPSAVLTVAHFLSERSALMR